MRMPIRKSDIVGFAASYISTSLIYLIYLYINLILLHTTKLALTRYASVRKEFSFLITLVSLNSHRHVRSFSSESNMLASTTTRAYRTAAIYITKRRTDKLKLTPKGFHFLLLGINGKCGQTWPWRHLCEGLFVTIPCFLVNEASHYMHCQWNFAVTC